MNKNEIRYFPLGGAGEIGRNMHVFSLEDRYLIVDCGVQFPDNSMLGVDYIIPDMQILQGKEDKIVGVVITHGHEDHIGGLSYLFDIVENVPIYATPLTAGLIEVKLMRAGKLSKTKINVIAAGDVLELGPFQIETFHMTHSIPDCIGLAISTPHGYIVMSGDYKLDPTPIDNWPSDYSKLAQLGEKGVLALFSDSTNAERPGMTPSERDIDEAFEEVFAKTTGRIIISSFASLISRLQQVATIAIKNERKICIVGTSMVDNVALAKKLGYLDMPESEIVSLEEALKLPDHKVLILCTGSQGEPTSILGRLSTGKYYAFSINPGDTVLLSSSPIPGNEEQISNVINRLYRMGANVIYNSVLSIHVSGHACQEEMKMLVNFLKPKYIIPTHGELRHLHQHARLMKQMGYDDEHVLVIENGQSLIIADGKVLLGDKVPATMVLVDGTNVGDMDMDIMYQRERLSENGVVVVSLVFDKKHHGLIQEPVIVHYGLMAGKEIPEVEGELSRQVIEYCAKKNNMESNNIQKNIEQLVRKFFYNATRRSPWVIVNPLYV
ncbi:MAG: ribonuclease J [Chloroflexi bacterium]|nr:ribonuclease J [Chloroflexota bacterium]